MAEVHFSIYKFKNIEDYQELDDIPRIGVAKDTKDSAGLVSYACFNREAIIVHFGSKTFGQFW